MIRILVKANKRKARLKSANDNTRNCSQKENNLTGNKARNNPSPNRLQELRRKTSGAGGESSPQRRWSCTQISESGLIDSSGCLGKKLSLSPPSPSSLVVVSEIGNMSCPSNHGTTLTTASTPPQQVIACQKRTCPDSCVSCQSNNNSPAITITSVSTSTSGHSNSSSQTHDRTTRMLLAVLLIFLLTELPSGIITFLSVIYGDEFFKHVYTPLGDLLDFLAMINSAVNFILYCTMSRQFRITFRKTFCPNDNGDNFHTCTPSRASHHHYQRSPPPPPTIIEKTIVSGSLQSLPEKSNNTDNCSRNQIPKKGHNNQITFV